MRKILTLTAIIAATSAAATPEVTRHYGPAYAPDQAAQHLLIRGTTDIELRPDPKNLFNAEHRPGNRV